MRVLVLDLDGSVVEQPSVAELIATGEAEVVPAQDLAPQLRIVAGRRALQELRSRLGRIDPTARDVTLLGSGDFHHLTYLLLEPLREEVTVIHFDNHPDWVRFPTSLNCGSWINHALRLQRVRRIVTIGPCSRDLSLPELKAANLPAVRDGRLEVYAWKVSPTRLLGRPVNGPGATTRAGLLEWRNISEECWSAFIAELGSRLPAGAIWITIDKDVLTGRESVTNWDQGLMSLEHVLTAIESLGRCRKIVGVDICGDYSLPHFEDPFRAFLSATDRPRKRRSASAARAVNDAANRRLLRHLRSVFQ